MYNSPPRVHVHVRVRVPALILCSMVAICPKQQTCHLFVIAVAHEKKLRSLLIVLYFVVSNCIM
jgi:hypothetical protein